MLVRRYGPKNVYASSFETDLSVVRGALLLEPLTTEILALFPMDQEK